MATTQLIRSDFDAFMRLDQVRPRGLSRALDVLSSPGFLAVVLYRLGSSAARRGLRPVARLIALLNFTLFSCDVSPRLTAGPGFVLPHPEGVALGAGVTVGSDVQIYKNVSIGTAGYADPARDGFPQLGDGVRIFDGARLFGPLEIGDGARVGTGVTLYRSVPAGATVTDAQRLEIRHPDGRVDLDDGRGNPPHLSHAAL